MNARCCSFVRDKHLNVILLGYKKNIYLKFLKEFFLPYVNDYYLDKKVVQIIMVREMYKQKKDFHKQV